MAVIGDVFGQALMISSFVFTMMLVIEYVNVLSNGFLQNRLSVLAGLIPQSGPHLVFVTLFASGALPFSILLASSITQDGHGMLPLLAHSRKDFSKVKTINMITGFLAGAILLPAGV